MNLRSNIESSKTVYQDGIAITAGMLIIFGMLHARALASIGMILMVLNAFLWKRSRLQRKHWLQDRFALASALFFLTYLVSGIWSEQTDAWAERIMIKLPFLLLPLGFYPLLLRSLNAFRVLVYGLSMIFIVNICGSLHLFVQDAADIIASYGASKVLSTSVYEDHIRFSLGLVMLSLLNFYFLFEKWQVLKKWDVAVITFNLLLLIGFNHLLATKTGLLTFYLMMGILGFGKLYAKSRYWAILFLLLLPLCGILSYKFVPTITQKIDYVRTELEQINQPDHQLDYNYSDQGRLISYQLALNVIKKNIAYGTGVGDVKEKMDAEYAQHYPQIPEANRLIPHNQFLYVLLAVGALLFCVFLFMVFTSFGYGNVKSIYTIASAAVFVLAMCVEPMLEAQFGVLVYLFFTLLFHRLTQLSKKP
jgi:O-antigen ligase